MAELLLAVIPYRDLGGNDSYNHVWTDNLYKYTYKYTY